MAASEHRHNLRCTTCAKLVGVLLWLHATYTTAFVHHLVAPPGGPLTAAVSSRVQPGPNYSRYGQLNPGTWQASSRAGLRRWAADELDNNAETTGPAGSDPESSGLRGKVAQWWETSGKEDFRVYGTSLVAALIFRAFVLEPRFIPSLSMFPTFEIGDQLGVEKVTKLYRPYSRHDVVVFRPPPAFAEYSSRGMDEALIKRIVAVAGDRVEIKGGQLYINGEAQDEDFIADEPEYTWGPRSVPPGMVMVLGDNRNHSLDSHIWGFLPTENVIGRAVFKYWPPWRLGLVED